MNTKTKTLSPELLRQMNAFKSLFENSLWSWRRSWTECARPRAQQRWKDGWCGYFKCARNAYTAAPEDGRTPTPDFSNRLFRNVPWDCYRIPGRKRTFSWS